MNRRGTWRAVAAALKHAAHRCPRRSEDSVRSPASIKVVSTFNYRRNSMMKFFAVALALIFTAAPVKGKEIYSGVGAEFSSTLGVAAEIDRLAALLGDEMLRDMVCRLSTERFSFGGLSTALGLPEGQVMRRIQTLRSWGLVRTARLDSARTIIEPIPGDGARTLRRWAERYCPTGDNCGRPAASPEPARGGRARGTNNPGKGVASGEVGASLEGKLVTIFGGSGFLGRDLTQHLLDAGARVRVASRNPDLKVFPEALASDGRLSKIFYDARDGDGVALAVRGAAMVVNLVGLSREEVEGQEFIDAVGRGVQIMAKATAEGADRFVHISGISADPKSPFVHGRANAAGEAAAREAFPGVTIVRPSLVVHPEKGFFKELAEMSRFNPDYAISSASKTRFQAVYVGDVSEAIVRILKNPDTKGRTYELGGPRAIPLSEIFSIVTRQTGQRPPPMPLWLAQVQSAIYRAVIPHDFWKQNLMTTLTRDNVVRPNSLGFADLDLTPTRVEDMMEAHHQSGAAADGKYTSDEPAPAY